MRTRHLLHVVAALATLLGTAAAAAAAPTVEIRPAGVSADLVVGAVPAGGATVLVDGLAIARLARPGVVRVPLSRLRAATSAIAIVGGSGSSSSRVELVVARARLVGPTRRGLRLREGVPGWTTASTARIRFTLPRGTKASCRVDRRRSRPCNRGLFAVKNLAPGPHAVRIRLLGRRRTQLVHRFTVVPPPPAVAILRAPTAVVERSPVRIGWMPVGGAPARAATCELDGAPLASCPADLEFERLPVGSHVLRIGLENAGGRGSATVGVRVTARPPNAPPDPPVVTITTTPASSRSRSATIAWRTSGLVDAVRCSIDGGVPVPCTSPATRTGLAPGDHAFVVTAVGPDGTESARATWRVMQRRLLWGSWVYGPDYGFDSVPWDMRGLQQFEANAGAQPAIVHFGQPWYRSGVAGTFHPTPYDAIRGHGSLPMVDWTPWDSAIGESGPQPAFALARIIAGDHDAYIRAWATGAKAWGQPFFLRFAHEMNGTWYPWSERKNGNAAGEFARAWRHVHDIFTEVGATNVTWVWCVNAEYPGSQALPALYPGDAYVDWVAVDGYNWGPATIHPTNWKSFDQLFGPTYASLRAVAPTRPVMIAETASSETGGSKPAWIADAYARAASDDYAALGAIMWFNWGVGGDWRIETSPATTAAFRAAVTGPAYPSAAPPNAGLVPVRPLPDV